MGSAGSFLSTRRPMSQHLVLATGPVPFDSASFMSRCPKIWLSKERRLSVTDFVRRKGVLSQRRRAQRSDSGQKRARYGRKRPVRDGPARGLVEAEAVALQDAPQAREASSILDEMSPPKRKRKQPDEEERGQARSPN